MAKMGKDLLFSPPEIFIQFTVMDMFNEEIANFFLRCCYLLPFRHNDTSSNVTFCKYDSPYR